MFRIIILLVLVFGGCKASTLKKNQISPEKIDIINTNLNGKGPEISLELYKGDSFYYPLLAVWIENESGNYIQSLYVPTSVATGEYKFGKQEKGQWVPGIKRTPQTLPYWAHKRGIVASDGLYMPEQVNELADSYSGASPLTGFILNTRADKELPPVYRILVEINQNWDWNEYWTNDKYPDDDNYKMSCQPALIYSVIINTASAEKRYKMKPVGHSHYSGKTGELFTDLSTITTALNIADSIIVRIK